MIFCIMNTEASTRITMIFIIVSMISLGIGGYTLVQKLNITPVGIQIPKPTPTSIQTPTPKRPRLFQTYPLQAHLRLLHRHPAWMALIPIRNYTVRVLILA